MKTNAALIFAAVLGLAVAAPKPKPCWGCSYGRGSSYSSPLYTSVYSAPVTSSHVHSHVEPVYTAPIVHAPAPRVLNSYTTYAVGTPEYIPEKTTVYKTSILKHRVRVPVEYTYEYEQPTHSATVYHHAPVSTSYVSPAYSTNYVSAPASYAPLHTGAVYSAPAASYSKSYSASHSHSHVHAHENYGGSWK